MILVQKTPETWLGAICEQCLGFVSRSVIIGDDWYTFKRGRGFLKLPASQARGGDQPGNYQHGDKEYLNSLVGSRWRIRLNCITVFSRVWRPAMQSNADDRNAVSKSVIVAIVIIVSALLGVHFGVQKLYVDPNMAVITGQLETLKRSQAAHFGILKSEIEGLKHGDSK